MRILLASFTVSLLLTALLIRLARRFGWNFAPRPDRWSQRAVAKFGGVPILVTLLGSALCFPLDRKLAAVIGLTILMGGLGFLDDQWQLFAAPKLAAQVLLCAAAAGMGVIYPLTSNPYLNAWCTVAWLVGITNAFNIIDNMDGLSTGVAVIVLAKLLLPPGPSESANSLMLALAGALLGFLVFNFYPAKIFMGDTGSLGVGFFLGCSAVLSADPLSGKVAMIGIPVLIFFLPLFDVALASFTRRWNGRPMMAGAKDHTSHRLVLLGMSERRAVLVLYLISAGGCGIAALWTSEWRHLGATMVVLYLVASAGLWLYLARIKMPGSWLAPRNPGALTVPEWLSGIADRVQKIGSAETPLVPERKAKVVRIIGRLNVGGPARQACYLHDRLHHAFHTVLITGQLAEGEGDMSHLLPAADNLYRVNAMSRSIRPWSDLKAFFSIVAILRRERPDIVHTHTAKAGALGRLAAILAGVPIRVHTYHGNVFEGYFSPFTSRIVLALERLLGKLTTRVIAISESQATELSERFQVIERERIVLIRTGFELLPFVECDRGPATRERLGVGPGEFLVLWSGRMEPIKNVQLLAAVIRAAQGNPRFRFLVAGAGTESAKFELLAGSCRNVIRTGWCWPMTDMISASDAVLLTSHNEGTPATLIEAMSAGKPFVATEVGGVPDLAVPPLLRRGVGQGAQAANGFLTALDPHLVLACLERLAADPELARAMGERGQRFALEMHSADRLRDEIENLYFDLVAESSSSRLRNMTWDRGGNGVPAESRRQPEGGSTPNSKEERARSSSVSR